MANRAKWSNSEIEQLIELAKDGQSAKTIAKKIGRTEMAVNVKLSTYGIGNRGKRLDSKSNEIIMERIRHLWFDEGLDVYTISEMIDLYPLKIADMIKRMQFEDVRDGNIKDTVNNKLNISDDPEIPFFWDRKHNNVDPSDLIQAYEAIRQKLNQFDRDQSEVTIELSTTSKWIMLVLLGDYHIGSLGTNLQDIENDHKLIANTKDVYWAFMGDATDNFTSSLPLSGIHDQIVSPRAARRLFEHLVSIVANKTLFLIHGCHDDFSVNKDDYNFIEEIAMDHRVAYLGHGGTANIMINGNEVYRVAAWHKMSGHSIHNIYYPCIKYLRHKDPTADIVACAHNHVTGISVESHYEQQKALLRTGCYKDNDRFAKKLGYKPVGNKVHKNVVPCVLINTEHKEMRSANSIQEGIDLLKSLNAIQDTDTLTPQRKKRARKNESSTKNG